MPVVAIPYESVLQLRLVTGTEPESGAPIIKTKSFNKVKDSASEQDTFDIANQLVSLQKYGLEEIRLRKTTQLTSS